MLNAVDWLNYWCRRMNSPSINSVNVDDLNKALTAYPEEADSIIAGISCAAILWSGGLPKFRKDEAPAENAR